MKHLFIVNPTAGGRDKTETVARRVEELFRNRSDKYEIYVTKAAMDAPEKIRRAAMDGEHLRIYACGGDGTFNECVCGAAGLENAAVCPTPPAPATTSAGCSARNRTYTGTSPLWLMAGSTP
ncbi:MAG: acylglycerol kinase family protein [Oscillospiraceae bacterium]